MAKVFKVTIEKNRCKGCGLCPNTCPKQVLAMSKEINDKVYFYSHVVDQPACIGCRFCAFMCPDVAISVAQEDAA
jgi:2-oxoglutarate ferredoxin oxidoreductase subunit delta